MLQQLSSKKELIGLDIGTQSIKMVELKSSGKNRILSKCAIERYAEDVTSEISPQERRKIVVDALKRIIAANKISRRKICTSISGNSVIVRFVKFPRMSAEDLDKTIQFEAEPYIPFDIREVNISTQILGEIMEEGEPRMETVLVAAKKDLLLERIEIVQEADLVPAIIDVDAFALENAYAVNRQAEDAETVMLVDIGATITNINILSRGVAKVVRDLFTAGNGFTKAVQKALQTDFKEAELLKKEFGIQIAPDAATDEKARKVSSALLPSMRELVGEIRRSIDYYHAQSGREGEVERIVLSGGSALLKNLDRYLSEQIGLTVNIDNPFSQIDPKGVSASLAEEAPGFSVAVGLATRFTGDK